MLSYVIIIIIFYTPGCKDPRGAETKATSLHLPSWLGFGSRDMGLLFRATAGVTGARVRMLDLLGFEVRFIIRRGAVRLSDGYIGVRLGLQSVTWLDVLSCDIRGLMSGERRGGGKCPIFD